MGELPVGKSLFLFTTSRSSTRSLNLLSLGKFWRPDNQGGCIPSIIVLQTAAVDFEIRTIGMRQLGSAIRINFSDCERLDGILEPYEDLDDKEEDSEEDPEMDLDEEEEDLEIDVDDKEEEEPLPASPPPLSPLRTPPPVSESSFDSDIPITTTTSVGRPFKGPLFTYEVSEPSTIASASVFSARYELNQLRQDFGILGSSAMNRDRIEKTQDQDGNQIQELRHHLTSAEIRLEVASVDRIMLPKRMCNADIERMIVDRVDAAIAAKRKPATAKAAEAAAAAKTTRAAATVGGARGSNNSGPAAGAGGPNVVGPTVGVIAMNAVPKVGGCSYKEFMNCEPTNFKGTEGAVGLTRWFVTSESVFLIIKCTENDKVCMKLDRGLNSLPVNLTVLKLYL
ncbi:hypothetical protein Tco_0601770 [Tanacetum coccineum]